MIDKAIQDLGIIVIGALVLGLFHIISKFQRLYHDHHDYKSTMASGSRDAKAKMETFKQRRELNRNRATFIVIAILIVILLWLHQDH